MTNDLDAALALSRFGLGARDGSLAAIGADPRGALRQEITSRALAMPAGPELRSTSALLVDLYAFLKERRLAAVKSQNPGVELQLKTVGKMKSLPDRRRGNRSSNEQRLSTIRGNGLV